MRGFTPRPSSVCSSTLQAAEPFSSVRVQSFWEMGELCKNAIEEIRVVSTQLCDESHATAMGLWRITPCPTKADDEFPHKTCTHFEARCELTYGPFFFEVCRENLFSYILMNRVS
jgi:hypothetical protein